MKRIFYAVAAAWMLSSCAAPISKADAIKLSEKKLSICLDRARLDFLTTNFVKLDSPEAEYKKLIKACQDRHESRLAAIEAYYLLNKSQAG